MAEGARITTVSEVMSSPALTATPDETVAAACARMYQRGVGSLVVVQGNQCVGLLTEKHIVQHVGDALDPDKDTVAQWMIDDPFLLGPQDDVVEAYHRIAKQKWRHIPVIEDGTVVGVVSERDLLRVARIEPVTQPGSMEAPKGLAGVIVAETEVGDVRGQEGFYHYRQYDATELARKRTLEDVWRLMFDGALPVDKAEQDAWIEQIRPLRHVPERVAPLLPQIARAGDEFVPLDALRSAVSLVAADADFKASLDISADELKVNAMQVCAVIPTLIASLWRLRQGEEALAPRDDLGYAANYLYMITGEVPEPQFARAVEQYQMTTIDHGFNASTFTARVITSTGADLGAAVVGGIGALSGPLHGGAPSRALDMLDAIGDPSNTEAWVRNAVESGDRIMGFGHRVYKTEDPRSALLKEVATSLGGPMADFASQVERSVVETLAELKPGRELYANVEFYAGVVMDRCGLPREMFTPTFASSRVIGWCANILEQAADNRIIRPSARYVGPPPPQPVPELP